MSLKWIDEKSCLTYNGRFFHAGDKIPAGILTESRVKEFIASGKIEGDAVKAEPEITEDVKKRGRKSNNYIVDDAPAISEDDDGELK